jgi:hypothetical protein
MKKHRLLSLVAVILLMLAFSMDALAWSPTRQTPPPRHGTPGHGAVGVPLDGGLLTILGMAGVAYFVARKKKKVE